MADALIHDERWSERLGRSVIAAVAAGISALLFGIGAGALLALTDSDPAWVLNGFVYWSGPLIFGVLLVGMILGLTMAILLHLAMLWRRPRGRGTIFLAGAVVAIAAAFGALALDSQAVSGSLAIAALLAATGFAGVFFYAMLERWEWTEPCAS